jgi:hypothetical protein
MCFGGGVEEELLVVTAWSGRRRDIVGWGSIGGGGAQASQGLT